jgi:hypothetical protein
MKYTPTEEKLNENIDNDHSMYTNEIIVRINLCLILFIRSQRRN